MPDFGAPAQLMGQQLASLVNQSVVDQRAEAFLEAEQRQQIAKNFEVKANLAHSLMAVDAPKALALMNDGLSGFGVSLTMEQFNPAMKGFEVMADLTKQGDHQGAQLVLTSMKKNGLLVNLEDQRRAAELERQNTAAISKEQAESVVALQFPDMAEAQQRVNAYRGFQQGQVDAPELARLYGTQDPTEVQQLFARDEARVQAFEAQAGIRHVLAKAFALTPGLGEKAIAASTNVVIDPVLRGKARLGQLLEQPTRTEAEERELMSLGARFGSESLQQALNIKTAQREAKALEQDLNEISSRADTFSRVMGVLGTAERSISEQAAARGVIHPLDGDLPTDQAKTVQQQHDLATKRLEAEAQIFQQQTAPIKQQAEDQAQTNRQLLNELAKRLVYALPGQKEELLKRKTEAEHVAKSSEALARLLDHESSYAIAQKEAALDTLPDGVDRDTAQAEITALKTARAKDLAIVGAEQERLLQRRKALTAGMQTAERKAELERRVTEAANAVDIARQRGNHLTTAMREAATQFDVPIKDLFTAVKEMQTLHLVDAQNAFAMLPPAEQTPQNAGKIGARYGVGAKDVLEGIKNPNKPLVEVSTGVKASEEAAKQFTQETRATYNQLKNAPMLLRNIEEAKALIPQAKGFMGPGGEGLLEAAKFLNARIGARINTEGIKSAEELRTRIFFNIMENLKKMDAQPSEMQQIMMRDALGKLGTDPNALANVLDAYGDTIRDKVELFNKEVAGAEKRGTVFPYDPRIVLPERRSATGEPMVKTDADYNALPSGTVFIGPDGKKRRKP